jgi:hypothetical protein
MRTRGPLRPPHPVARASVELQSDQDKPKHVQVRAGDFAPLVFVSKHAVNSTAMSGK